MHHGRIEGVANAHEIRDLILQQLRKSKDAGLGDDSPAHAAQSAWRPEHVAVLREIRDLCRTLR